MFQFRRFPSYTYLIQCRICGLFPQGFPHSDIHGSMLICSSPWLFAACHVLHRLLVPRHSPCALFCLTSLGSLKNYCGNLARLVVFFIPFAKTEKPLNCPFKCLLYRCLFLSSCSVFNVLFFGVSPLGGDEQIRTVDPLLARQVLSQLSYTPRSTRSPASASLPHLFLQSGGLKWTRTTDLALIRRAL